MVKKTDFSKAREMGSGWYHKRSGCTISIEYGYYKIEKLERLMIKLLLTFVGIALGDFEGAVDGDELGLFEGLVVDGLAVGDLEGLLDGPELGDVEGLEVDGPIVGLLVGICSKDRGGNVQVAKV